MATDSLARAPLLPRFRRPLTFGAVLDETFQLYRSHWLTIIGLSAVWAAPYVISLFFVTQYTNSIMMDQFMVNPPESPEEMVGPFLSFGGTAFGLGLLTSIFTLLGYGAIVTMTYWLMRGEREQRSIGGAYAVGLSRLLAFLLASIAYLLAMAVLLVLSIPFFILGVGGLLGGLVALLGIAVWAANPNARKGWLKWLIILATPFGLMIYFTGCWSLYGQAIVLERKGPISALRRSAELVSGQWFFAVGAVFVVALVAAILQSLPGGLIGAVLGLVVGFGPGFDEEGVAFQVITNAAGFVGTVLFGALSFITGTLVFVDLRNKAEGTDLAERLTALESSYGS